MRNRKKKKKQREENTQKNVRKHASCCHLIEKKKKELISITCVVTYLRILVRGNRQRNACLEEKAMDSHGALLKELRIP